jgi:hypothetical protein
MMFERDIHQTIVKNSSFSNPKFSLGLHSIYLILWLLKEHVRLQCIIEPFFRFSLFKQTKGMASSIPKNLAKNGVLFIEVLFSYDNNKAYLKKWAMIRTAEIDFFFRGIDVSF